MALRKCFYFLGIAAVLFFLAACTNGSEKANLAPEPQDIKTTGTVWYVQIEGGCWVIRTDDGRSLSPIKLPPDFMHDGLRVTLHALPRPDMVSKCMTGMIVEILSIEQTSGAPAR